MARHARLFVPGFPLHVRQRGNNRMRCFLEPNDFELFLGLMSEASRKTSCAVHAYVLMPNHYHLLVTPGSGREIADLMRHVNQRYAEHFNRKHRRTGTLWEGRFRSSVVDSQSYLLTCYRYVELNPVRAHMVQHPRDYPWSSYRTNAEGMPSLFVVPHELYMRLGVTDLDRLNAYAALFHFPLIDEVLEQIRAAAVSGLVIGSAEFAARLESQFGIQATRKKLGRPSRAQDVRL